MELLSLIHLPLPLPSPAQSIEDIHHEELPSNGHPHAQYFTHPFNVDDWRRMAKDLVDFVGDYYNQLLSRPSTMRVEPAPELRPGFLRSRLPDTAPERPEDFSTILNDVKTLILPGLLHWQHPSFFGYFPHSHSFPGVLADLLSSALGTLGFQWTTSPAMTEMEVAVLDWLVDILELPSFYKSWIKSGAGAALQNSASEAVLVSMVAARARAMQSRPIEDSIKLVAYCSDQAHSCVLKAAMVAGIVRCRVLPTTPECEYALQPDALSDAIKADIDIGLVPFWAAATIGTTSSCAVDPVSALADVCTASSVWLHVDAAYAGSFAMLPEMHHKYWQGIEKVDSYGMNPHKGMLTGWDCATIFVKDARWVHASMAITPEYLSSGSVDARPSCGPVASQKQPQDAQGVKEDSTFPEYKDWEVPLGTHFRALKLWFVMRLYGKEKLRAFQRHRLALQDLVVESIKSDPRFEFLPGAPPRMGLVCFRLAGASERQQAELLREINASGKLFMVHTKLSGRYVLRLAVGGTHTQPHDIRAAWKIVQRAADHIV